MNSVVGNQRQEEKIARLGTLAHEMFPEFGVLVFKGAFRHGLRDVLRQREIDEWQQVIDQPIPERRRFFHDVLQTSIPRLETIGLTRDQIKTLITQLTKENERYLQ
jgi:hypothetical protein